MWWARTGSLNLPLVVFSAPTKSPRQKVVIASGANPGGNGITTDLAQKPSGGDGHNPQPTNQSRVVSHRIYDFVVLRFCGGRKFALEQFTQHVGHLEPAMGAGDLDAGVQR